MRITIKTPSGRYAELRNEAASVVAKVIDYRGRLPSSDMDWMVDEGFADYIEQKIAGIESPEILQANGEVSI